MSNRVLPRGFERHWLREYDYEGENTRLNPNPLLPARLLSDYSKLRSYSLFVPYLHPLSEPINPTYSLLSYHAPPSYPLSYLPSPPNSTTLRFTHSTRISQTRNNNFSWLPQSTISSTYFLTSLRLLYPTALNLPTIEKHFDFQLQPPLYSQSPPTDEPRHSIPIRYVSLSKAEKPRKCFRCCFRLRTTSASSLWPASFHISQYKVL